MLDTWTFVYILTLALSIVKIFTIGRFYEKTVAIPLFVITLFSASAVSASALTNNILKVGIRWGSTALEAANLENAVGPAMSLAITEKVGILSIWMKRMRPPLPAGDRLEEWRCCDGDRQRKCAVSV